jgi:hypothetical protein
MIPALFSLFVGVGSRPPLPSFQFDGLILSQVNRQYRNSVTRLPFLEDLTMSKDRTNSNEFGLPTGKCFPRRAFLQESIFVGSALICSPLGRFASAAAIEDDAAMP